MNSSKLVVISLCAALMALPGCARKLSTDPGPDEFGVLPNARLVEPANYADLPPPTAGANAAEVSAMAQAMQALGGSGSVSPRLLGSGGSSKTRRGRGFLGGLFGGGRRGDVLDPNDEAARLQALGIPTAGGN